MVEINAKFKSQKVKLRSHFVTLHYIGPKDTIVLTFAFCILNLYDVTDVDDR